MALDLVYVHSYTLWRIRIYVFVRVARVEQPSLNHRNSLCYWLCRQIYRQASARYVYGGFGVCAGPSTLCFRCRCFWPLVLSTSYPTQQSMQAHKATPRACRGGTLRDPPPPPLVQNHVPSLFWFIRWFVDFTTSSFVVVATTTKNIS